MIKRKVLEKIKRPFEYVYDDFGILKLVADFNFCKKIQAQGFKIWGNFNIVCDHKTTVSIKGVNDLLVKVKK